MKTQLILPPKYYLDHFEEFLGVLRSKYLPFFEDRHHRYLTDYEGLSEDAKCAYIRLVNRKGKIFSIQTMRYAEISDMDSAIHELEEKSFIKTPVAEDVPAILEQMSKERLVQTLSFCFQEIKKSWPKVKLVSFALERSEQLLEKNITFLREWIIQVREEELDYLLFLYFGKIQSSLTLYALRDLGIRKTSKHKTSFESRFQTLPEASSHYFYSRLKQNMPLTLRNFAISALGTWPEPLNHLSSILREEILLQLFAHFKMLGETQKALQVIQSCKYHPAREKRARLLYELAHKDECLELLHEILEDPVQEEEHLFAEDFLARKFNKAKRSLLTETLKSAQKVYIDEAYFRHPELGIQNLLLSQGHRSYFTENNLWNTLFGILFWHELFESELSALYNEFDRVPKDLFGSDFFHTHKEAIVKKLEMLEDKVLLRDYIALIYSSKSEVINGIFSFYDDTLEIVHAFLEQASPSSVAMILTYMAQDFKNRNTGFPDLLSFQNGAIVFLEVKAEGDSLKQSQLKQIMALKRAGFDVEILQVQYKFNSEQTYVVVDIETTGGSAGYHRITELGAVKVRGGKVIEKFQTLINPQRSISRMIQELTGISNQMVAKAPKFHEVADSFNEFTKDAIFVAHNVQFDYSFIQKEFEKLDKKYVRPYICTKAGMRKHYPGLPSYSLKSLTSHFSIPLADHHRALCDAEASAYLLFLINQKRATVGTQEV